jgi:hypothetical protein
MAAAAAVLLHVACAWQRQSQLSCTVVILAFFLWTERLVPLGTLLQAAAGGGLSRLGS